MGWFADQSRARGDMLESVGTIEELAVSLSQQARIYLADCRDRFAEKST